MNYFERIQEKVNKGEELNLIEDLVYMAMMIFVLFGIALILTMLYLFLGFVFFGNPPLPLGF